MSDWAQHRWVPSGYLRHVKRHPTRIPWHSTVPGRIPRHPGGILLGTQLHLSEPQSSEHLNRPQDSTSDGKISQDSTAPDSTRRYPAGFPGTWRHPAGFFGTRVKSLAPGCILANLRAQSTSTDRRIPHQTAGFLTIPWHPTALDRNLRPPAKFSSLKTRWRPTIQTGFIFASPIPVAQDSRRRPKIQAEFVFASPIPRRPRLPAETQNSDRICLRLTDSPSFETLGGDPKFRQNSFSPHRFPVARDSRRLPLSQADTSEDLLALECSSARWCLFGLCKAQTYSGVRNEIDIEADKSHGDRPRRVHWQFLPVME